MPYIPDVKRRKELLDDPYSARNGGELNFIFSNLFLGIFKHSRSYDTIHRLKVIVNNPSTHPDFENLFYQIPKGKSGLNNFDVRAALDNAWAEFYRRVAVKYENAAIARNGDIYAEVIAEVEADAKAKETKVGA